MKRAVALAMLLAAATPLRAQSPVERAMLANWDDSLRTTSILSALEGASRRGTGRAADVRRALYQVRHADLADSRSEIELVLTNMHLLATRTRWAWPHYIMALAFEAMARKDWVETLSDGKKPAEKHADATWRTLRQALDRDPGFAAARKMLAELASAGGDRFLRLDQVTALERESRQPAPEPDALLAWGRHLRTLQSYSAALMIFNRAVARGSDQSTVDLERARTLLALGDSAPAVQAYWSGITHLTVAGRQAYRTDLWWITEPEELTAFDEMPDSAIARWLHRFWNARDAEAANGRGERLIEHLRRWVVAYERYRALSPWTDAFWSRVEMGFENAPCMSTDAKLFEQLWHYPPSPNQDLRAREPLLDHRGMLYLRHGEPIRVINNGGTGGAPVRRRAPTDPYAAAPQAIGPTGVRLPWSEKTVGEAPARTTGPSAESWQYWWDGALRIINFRGSEALGRYAATTLGQATPSYLLYRTEIASSLPIAEYYAMAKRVKHWNDSSVFGPSGPKWGPKDNPACFDETLAVVSRTARDEHASINRDSDTPPNFRGHNSIGQLFALGAAIDNSNAVLQTFAIPAVALQLDHLEDGQSVYAIQLRVVAYDRARDRTIELDTARIFAVSQPLVPGQFLSAYTELTLPPGNWQVATRASQINGAVVLQDVHSVHVDAGTGIALSDIVTGRPGNPPWGATDGSPFPLNYPNGWYPDETAELFFEVRGVAAGADYRTSLEVRPVNPRATGLSQIVSTDRGAGPVTYVRKTLGLTQLLPGKYRLVVTVEYQGRKVTREREILIVPRP